MPAWFSDSCTLQNFMHHDINLCSHSRLTKMIVRAHCKAQHLTSFPNRPNSLISLTGNKPRLSHMHQSVECVSMVLSLLCKQFARADQTEWQTECCFLWSGLRKRLCVCVCVCVFAA